MSLSSFKEEVAEDLRYFESTTLLKWFSPASKPQSTHLLVQTKPKLLQAHESTSQNWAGMDRQWKVISKTSRRCRRHCSGARLCSVITGYVKVTDVWLLQSTALKKQPISPSREGSGMLTVPSRQWALVGTWWEPKELLIYFTPFKAWQCVSPSVTSLGMQAIFQKLPEALSTPSADTEHLQYCQRELHRLTKPGSLFPVGEGNASGAWFSHP